LPEAKESVSAYNGSRCTVSMQSSCGKALVVFRSEQARDAVMELIRSSSQNGTLNIMLKGIQLNVALSKRSSRALRVGWDATAEVGATLTADVIAGAFDLAYGESKEGKKSAGNSPEKTPETLAPEVSSTLLRPFPPFVPVPGLVPGPNWSPEFARAAFAHAAGMSQFALPGWNVPGATGFFSTAPPGLTKAEQRQQNFPKDAQVWQNVMSKARADSQARREAKESTETQETSRSKAPDMARWEEEASLSVLKALQTFSSNASPENHEELDKELQEVLTKHLPETGAQQEILRTEADRVRSRWEKAKEEAVEEDDESQSPSQEQRMERDVSECALDGRDIADGEDQLREEHELIQQLLEDVPVQSELPAQDEVSCASRKSWQTPEGDSQLDEDVLSKQPEGAWARCEKKCESTSAWDWDSDKDSEEALIRDVEDVLRKGPEKLVRMASVFGFAKRYNELFHGGKSVNDGSWSKWLQSVPGVSIELDRRGSFSPSSLVTLRETQKSSSWDWDWGEKWETWRGDTWPQSERKRGAWEKNDWTEEQRDRWDASKSERREKSDSHEMVSNARPDRKRWVIKE